MPGLERSFELEVNRAKTIVRVTCHCEPPENAASFLGKRLDKVLTWDAPLVDGRVTAMLEGRIPCEFTVGKVGDYAQFAVYMEPQGFSMEALGSLVTFDRAVEIVEAVRDVPCTFAVGRYVFDGIGSGEGPPVCEALNVLLRSISEPLAFVTCNATSLFVALPKIERQEMGMRIEMFHAECRIEMHDKHRWQFGAIECDPPFSLHTTFGKCWDQAGRFGLYAPHARSEAS